MEQAAMKTKGFRLAFIAMILILTANQAAAIDISVTGSWSPSIGAADLISGAGSELISSYPSDSNQFLVAISNTAGSTDNWRVDVRRTDTNWDDSVTLSLQRTGAGSGSGAISGGSTYQAVTYSDNAFFSGRGDRTGIQVQLQLSGVSLAVPPDNYSTTIVFTVVDTQ